MPTPRHLPPLDADARLRVRVNRQADRVFAIATPLMVCGVVAALVLGCIAGISGTMLLDGPIALASAVFCLSLPFLLIAAVVAQFTMPRPFRYADRRLATTIAALRAGDMGAREQLLGWAAEHPSRVRDALRTAYHPDLLPLLLPLVQDPDPARRQLACVLLDLEQAAVLPMLLPLLEGRRRTTYLKQRMRTRQHAEAAFIAAYVLGPLRRWTGPPQPPPHANLLYALLVHWPALATDDDLERALTLPDYRCEVRWLNGRGEQEVRRRPRAYVAVREVAARERRVRRRARE